MFSLCELSLALPHLCIEMLAVPWEIIRVVLPYLLQRNLRLNVFGKYCFNLPFLLIFCLYSASFHKFMFLCWWASYLSIPPLHSRFVSLDLLSNPTHSLARSAAGFAECTDYPGCTSQMPHTVLGHRCTHHSPFPVLTGHLNSVCSSAQREVVFSFSFWCFK